jgi:peptide-methionine (R)-S-oxide reductase
MTFPAKGVRAVLIEGKSGGYGDDNNSSRELSGPVDLNWLRATRATADAIVVSYGTAVREHYKRITLNDEFLVARRELGFTQLPLLIVVTRNPEHAADASRFADIVLCKSEFNWAEEISELARQGIIRLSVEGGPALIDAIMAQKVIDQFALTVSPHEASNTTSYEHIDAFKLSPEVFRDESDGFVFSLLGVLPTYSELLNAEEREVLRMGGTQAPFAVEYEKKPADGYYACRACGNELFSAETQFDARCGWPAFWTPSRTDAVRLIEDRSHGMHRVEVRCKACDSHLGHVFSGEGFGFPTDQRFCINAICLVRKH